MGLDMYLTRKKYIGGKFYFRNVKGEINININGIKIPIDLKKISYIEEEVAYWRKANHIHKWFVDNIQEGNDDCKSYYLETEDLEKLLEVCEKVKKSSELIEKTYINDDGIKVTNKVLKDDTMAKKLLPCQSGFFFGSTEYDEWYLKDIEYTINTINEILKEEEELNKVGFYSEFKYRASW